MNKILYWSSLLILLVGCELNDDLELVLEEEKSFEFHVNVYDSKSVYSYNDTLWIEADIDNRAVDMISNQEVTIENPTVLIAFEIEKLFSKVDSIDFISDNFKIIEDNGILEYTNTLNNSNKFLFNLSYGLPIESKLRVGLVLKHPGVFAMKASGKLYYGANRTNYETLVDENTQVASLIYTFSNTDINKSVYNNLSQNLIDSYTASYPEVLIDSKRFYFMDVAEN